MSGTTTKLTAAAEGYFADLPRVRASGDATQERSLYGPLDEIWMQQPEGVSELMREASLPHAVQAVPTQRRIVTD